MTISNFFALGRRNSFGSLIMSRRNSESSTSLTAGQRGKSYNLDRRGESQGQNSSIEGNSSVECDNKSAEGDYANTIEGDEESITGENNVSQFSSVKRSSKVVPINDSNIV